MTRIREEEDYSLDGSPLRGVALLDVCHTCAAVYRLLSLFYSTIIIIIIISTTMFMVLSSWQSHCESSPGSFDECRYKQLDFCCQLPHPKPTLDAVASFNARQHQHHSFHIPLIYLSHSYTNMHVTFMLSYFPNLSTKSLLHFDHLATAVRRSHSTCYY